MADRFCYSGDGDNADDGSTWALAKATAAGVDAIDSAGDRWLFDYRHSEATGALTLAVAGTLATPSQLLSVTQSGASGIGALTAGATISTPTTGQLVVTGSFYAYGITFQAGSSTSSAYFYIGQAADNALQVFDTCGIAMGGSGSAGRFWLGGSYDQNHKVEMRGCTITFAHVSQTINLRNTVAVLRGCTFAGSAATLLFDPSTNGADICEVLVDGCDLSALASSVNLIDSGAPGGGKIIFRNCKMPSSWSGSLFVGAPANMNLRGEMWNCNAGDINYQMWIEDYAGSIKHETTLVRTGGASDGTTTISWKMTGSSSASYPTIGLRSPEIMVPNTSTGSSQTLTVEILHDSATNLQDDEVWMEVSYQGTSGTPLALFASDAVASVVASPADQTTSSETWTTTGMSNPNKQKLSVSVTPQEIGCYVVRVCLAKASYTVYVDPLVTVS